MVKLSFNEHARDRFIFLEKFCADFAVRAGEPYPQCLIGATDDALFSLADELTFFTDLATLRPELDSLLAVVHSARSMFERRFAGPGRTAAFGLSSLRQTKLYRNEENPKPTFHRF